jgi:hypothetical protein
MRMKKRISSARAPERSRPWYLERIPDWFKDGISARPSKGRKSFTDWNYFTKDSKLVPSGLIGPVKVLQM